MLCGSGGSKSRLAKAAGAEPSGQMRDEKLHAVVTPFWREADLEVKKFRNNFGSGDVEKVHGVVARSTFGSTHVENTLVSEHFWKLRCSENARCCGAKHMWK